VKRFLWASLVAVAACEPRSSPPAPQPPPGEAWLSDKQVSEAKIVVEPVAIHPVSTPVVAPARVAFDDLRVAHVFSPVAGRVLRVLAGPGDRVRRGTPLAVLESPDVGQAFSDLAKAEADLRAAEQEHQRQKELYEARAGARRDLEAAESSYLKAKAEIDRARQKAKLLPSAAGGSASQEYELRSPIDGEVIFRSLNPGMEVQGQYTVGQAVELFTIGELDPVWVVADVFALDLPAVAVGADARVALPALPGRAFDGKVQWVSGALDPAARTAKVRIVLPNPRRELRPEMLGTATIAGRPRDELAVPRTALLRLGDQTVVFVDVGRAPDGRVRFERRPVEVDDAEGDWVAVRNGIKPGDRVVTSGAILLVGLL